MANNCLPAITIMDIISVITLVCNVILFIVNYKIVQKNKKIGIRHSIDLNFYELTLLKSLKEYFNVIGNVNNRYSNLVNEYTKTSNEKKCRELSEGTIKDLDNMYEKCENEVSPYIIGFSTEANTKIHGVFERYYDNTTEIFSNYSQSSLNQTKLNKLQSSFSENTNKFISDLYKLIKEYCPR